MTKKVAPAKLTGGKGFNYEDFVAARFLLGLLGADHPLGPDLGRLVRIEWQAADSGWRLDDLAITFGEGDSERAVGISVKSHRQVTRSGFDESFSTACWEQWLGVGTTRRLRIDRDQMALVTGELAEGVRTAWEDTLGEAIENAAAPERLVARLQPPAKDSGSQSSETQRSLFASLHCPASLGDARVTDEVQTAVLLRHIRLVHLDFESNPSQPRSDALATCRGLLRHDTAEAAEVLWDNVVRIAARKRGSGGSIELPELLAGLRRRHVLKYHPDFRNDWAELDRRSRERFELIRLDVGGVARLRRRSVRQRLLVHFSADRVCVLAGVSGVGKSAIVRAIAGQKHRLVWLTAELLLPAAGTTFEAHLGLSHSFAQVVAASPAPCLVVFDGVEGLSDSALQCVARLVASLRADRPGKVRVALTVQSEAFGRLQWAFALAGLPVGSLGIELVRPPGGAAVDRLLVRCPGLSVAALRPEFRTLLRNLKVFDWAARLHAAGGLAAAADVTTLTALIDRLWAYFVEGDSAGLARSALLKRIAATEADGLLQGLPVSEVASAELALVSPLAAAGLVVRRDERLRLVHDMFADWARLKHLIELRLPYSEPTIHQAATAGWYRAVRLYAQRLLEQPHGGVDAWQRQLQAVGAGTPERAIVRGLFLEALVLAHDSHTLLTAAWPALVAGEGQLLSLLIDRFAYVGTLPDARLLSNLPDRAGASKLEHLIRLPFEPYWGGVLEALGEHPDDVIRCALAPAAGLLKLWLSKVPLRRPGANGLRRAGGRLILTIAREVQAQEAERRGEVEKGERTEVYTALLWAAPEYPQEVAQLCLELANRRPEAEAAGLRRETAAERGRQMIAARSVADERSARFFLGSLRLEDDSVPRREPWPDGPRHRVDEAFQVACLDWQAILPLWANLPAEASEILLAVLIEHPRHHDSDVGSFMYDAFGLDECRPCDPAFYDQGPFWTLLRYGEATAESALTLIIKVANFATERWREHQILLHARHGGEFDVGPNSVQIPGPDGLVEHPGDRNVLCWHSGLRTHPSVLSSMLMAVEKWLYDEADAGRPVDRWVGRIFGEGRSAALVGVLVQLGKRKPELLAGPLRPLLGAYEVYAMEHRLQMELYGLALWSMDWMLRGEVAWNRSRDWHGMPHRKTLLLNHFLPLILNNESVRAEAIKVYTLWEEWCRTSPHDIALRSALSLFGVVIRYFRQSVGGESAEGFQIWLQAQKHAALAQELKAAEQLLPLTFAVQCRKRLDDNCPLTPDELPPFWEAMQSLASRPEDATEDGTRVIDSLLGGVAVLMTLHREWLRVEPAREVWCTEQLVRCVRQPPRRRAYDMPESAGSWSWDNFAAECGVALLAEDPADPLARRLVLDGMTCFRFATVSATICRAYRLRTRLGEEFERMKAFVGEWSACVWACARRNSGDSIRSVCGPGNARPDVRYTANEGFPCRDAT